MLVLFFLPSGPKRSSQKLQKFRRIICSFILFVYLILGPSYLVIVFFFFLLKFRLYEEIKNHDAFIFYFLLIFPGRLSDHTQQSFQANKRPKPQRKKEKLRKIETKKRKIFLQQFPQNSNSSRKMLLQLGLCSL